ncbi:MAG TPA: TMEM43 family protein, partial [Candidatus Ozemobacteraceae bacterium]|nr:TMEM43 family protein [Candidatus Ozemobacteraceae bacterium]
GVTISSTRSYAHNRIWYPGPIDSTRFQNSTLYANPPAGNFTLHSWSQKAPEVSLQAFRLRSELVEAISVEEPLRLPEVPPVFSTGPYKSSGAKLFENGVYLGSSPSNPQIGDRRILFSVVKPPAVSIVARQTGKLFMPYQTNKGGEIEIIDRGTNTIDELFARAHQQTSFAAWVQRLFVVPWLAIGLYLLFLSETPLTLLFPGFSSLAQYGSIGRIAPICLSTAAIIVVTVWFAVQSPVIGAIVLTAVTAAALFRTRGEDA